MIFKTSIVFILFLVSIDGIAQVEFGTESDKILITQLEVLEDSSNQMSFKEVQHSSKFELRNGKVLNLGVSQSSFWLKCNLRINNIRNPRVLIIEQPKLNEIEVFLFKSGKVHLHERQGRYESFNKRKYNCPNYVFDLESSEKGEYELFIKVRGNEQLIVPVFVSSKEGFFSEIAFQNVFFGLYCGIILAMVCYNLFIYSVVRDKGYLFYVGTVFFLGITQVSLKGYGFQFFWPDNIWIEDKSTILFSSIASIFSMFFFRYILFIKKKFIVNLIVFGFATNVVFVLLNYYSIALVSLQFFTLVIVFYILFVALKKYKDGIKSARFFLLAWTTLLIGLLVFILKDFDVLPYNIYTNYSVLIGSGIEAILLSFALADKINVYKKDKTKAVKEKEQLLLKQNIQLEEKVGKRTEELALLNKELKRQALSAQIDPHFIFNALNSIQNFILKSDKLNAQKYLSKFARLMRFHLNSSLKKYIPLKDELDAITSYLELEKLRFENRFQFEIRLDANLDARNLEIPSMLLIPFLENAVWHGILPRDDNNGVINIDIKWEENELTVEIKDNGIGIRASEELKDREVLKEHESAGVKITKERLELMHSYTGTKAFFTVESDNNGTIVSFLLPVKKP